MKKINILLILAIAMIFAQCKKDDNSNATPIEPVGTKDYAILLTAGTGGAKTDINGNNITWTEGDKIYVGNSTGYLGCLELSSGEGTGYGTFTGNISLSGTIEGMKLNFFYLSETARTISTGAETFDIDFNDQTGNLDGLTANFHIGYGSAILTSDYNYELIYVETTLTTKIAIAYMNLDAFEGENVAVSGTAIYNKITVDFTDGTCYGKTKGAISLGTVTAGTSKYVALIPSGSNSTRLQFHSPMRYGTVDFGMGIEANKLYSNNGEAIQVPITRLGLPGEFSAGGKTVFFSGGNLQYIGSAETPYWKFADNQWNYMGNGNQSGGGNVTIAGATAYNNTDATNACRDLFGWGTSGYKDTRDGEGSAGANNYQLRWMPYETSTEQNTISGSSGINYYGYGPDYYQNIGYDLTVASKSDWGVNTISNGGDGHWRTLTKDEWVDVCGSYGMATVNSVPGMVILPDDWTLPECYCISFTLGHGSGYSTNTYSALEWLSMEAEGAVFLPAAGNRDGTSVLFVGRGYYWSSSSYNDEYDAYDMDFGSDYVSPSNNYGRYNGLSVRLVADY